MGRWWFDWFSGSVSFYIFLVGGLLVYVCSYPIGVYSGLVVSGIFSLDVVGFYLILLSVLLGISLMFFVSGVSSISHGMLVISLTSSVLCYCCMHVFWFWCFYEVSILALLVLLVVESPYPERYVASWYLLGYVLLSSLPMLLCLVYLSVWFGSMSFGFWSVVGGLGYEVMLVLCVLFISKIPIFPFHVWLPLVHAEATFPVSVCLSGYVMKLGILGLCRVCSYVLPDVLFHIFYLVVCLVASVVFFVCACVELDTKRWLALMSLAHINISCVCLGVGELENVSLAMLYSVGHGLSAGLMFLVLWVAYLMVGSRNWFVLKYLVSGGVVLNCLFVGSLCAVMSFPPTVQFFCEVFAVSMSSGFSCVLFFFLGGYIFLGGIIPLVLLGGLLTRHVSLRGYVNGVFGQIVSVIFLVLLCFSLFLFV